MPIAREPVTTLRGAGVEVDARRVGRIAGAVVLLALAGVVVGLFVSGAQKNGQITRLRRHGVVVEVTVSSCRGLMGGSGSNLAGYACTGTFAVGGRRYDEAIPGDTPRAPGATLRAVTVADDPALVVPVSVLATERASWKVFLLPTSLLILLALLVAAIVISGRGRRTTPEVSLRDQSVSREPAGPDDDAHAPRPTVRAASGTSLV